MRQAAENLPAEVGARLETAAKLSDEDRQTIVEIARQARVRFQSKPAADPAPAAQPEAEPTSKADAPVKP